ncbi:MAG TPA: glycosyltransferase family 4 protein, partial [Polyangiales bacterium]|nr:glycosyltransferase family 4 protein [Polyangiales bacterium]
RNLAGKVELLGWKKQHEVAQLMREADVFAFPSIRELGAGVVVEAMACGLACVVVDYGGPGTLIDHDRGVKVPLSDKATLIRAFGQALEKLVRDPETSVRLGTAAREHALRYYTWDAKAKKTLAVYEAALGRAPRPTFWDAR